MIAQRRKRKKESEDDTSTDTTDSTSEDVPEVDFNSLHMKTLRRYKRHFKVPTRPGLSKIQLAEILINHFKTLPVKEINVISSFIYTVKTNGNKLEKNEANAD